MFLFLFAVAYLLFYIRFILYFSCLDGVCLFVNKYLLTLLKILSQILMHLFFDFVYILDHSKQVQNF